MNLTNYWGDSPVTDPFVATLPIHRRLLTPANRARNRRQDRRAISLRRPVLWTAVLALLSFFHCTPVIADELSKKQMQGLDEQVQEIKSDVLRIASELSLLEEKLLYPSNTQVALFVSLPSAEKFRLDSVQIQIDGEVVAHHIYTFKELEALERGGVQRIYTGNVPTGDHQLEVSIDGKLPSGVDFSGSESFDFRKDVEPKLVELTLAGPGSGGASIRLGGE
jgi:hypothetical protein